MSSSVSDRPAIAADGEEVERITAPIRWGQRRLATAPANAADLLPPMRWDQLEAVLTAMASTSDRAVMVRHLLAGARYDAARLPVEETIRDILCIGAAAATDQPAVRPAA